MPIDAGSLVDAILLLKRVLVPELVLVASLVGSGGDLL